jgi:hypothetical protein
VSQKTTNSLDKGGKRDSKKDRTDSEKTGRGTARFEGSQKIIRVAPSSPNNSEIIPKYIRGIQGGEGAPGKGAGKNRQQPRRQDGTNGLDRKTKKRDKEKKKEPRRTSLSSGT